jgi:hypothetical protein
VVIDVLMPKYTPELSLCLTETKMKGEEGEKMGWPVNLGCHSSSCKC